MIPSDNDQDIHQGIHHGGARRVLKVKKNFVAKCTKDTQRGGVSVAENSKGSSKQSNNTARSYRRRQKSKLGRRSGVQPPENPDFKPREHDVESISLKDAPPFPPMVPKRDDYAHRGQPGGAPPSDGESTVEDTKTDEPPVHSGVPPVEPSCPANSPIPPPPTNTTGGSKSSGPKKSKLVPIPASTVNVFYKLPVSLVDLMYYYLTFHKLTFICGFVGFVFFLTSWFYWTFPLLDWVFRLQITIFSLVLSGLYFHGEFRAMNAKVPVYQRGWNLFEGQVYAPYTGQLNLMRFSPNSVLVYSYAVDFSRIVKREMFMMFRDYSVYQSVFGANDGNPSTQQIPVNPSEPDYNILSCYTFKDYAMPVSAQMHMLSRCGYNAYEDHVPVYYPVFIFLYNRWRQQSLNKETLRTMCAAAYLEFPIDKYDVDPTIIDNTLRYTFNQLELRLAQDVLVVGNLKSIIPLN